MCRSDLHYQCTAPNQAFSLYIFKDNGYSFSFVIFLVEDFSLFMVILVLIYPFECPCSMLCDWLLFFKVFYSTLYSHQENNKGVLKFLLISFVQLSTDSDV